VRVIAIVRECVIIWVYIYIGYYSLSVMSTKPYRTYSYAVFVIIAYIDKGHQKVGKSNIINRIIKDEFQDAYKHTLENLQTMLV
jgi:hypothetical protein